MWKWFGNVLKIKGGIVLIFEVLTAVNLKITVHWALTTFSLVDSHQHFGGTEPSEKSIIIYQTTLRHVPEDRNLRVQSPYSLHWNSLKLQSSLCLTRRYKGISLRSRSFRGILKNRNTAYCNMMTVYFNKKSHPLIGNGKLNMVPRRGKHVSAATNNHATTEEWCRGRGAVRKTNWVRCETHPLVREHVSQGLWP
jgi:hypothetical protein